MHIEAFDEVTVRSIVSFEPWILIDIAVLKVSFFLRSSTLFVFCRTKKPIQRTSSYCSFVSFTFVVRMLVLM